MQGSGLRATRLALPLSRSRRFRLRALRYGGQVGVPGTIVVALSAFALVTAGLTARTTPAQDQARTATAQDQPPRPTFRTEANYVRVDVFPTKDGAPIVDLNQEDFEIFEAGAPQKIEQFEHVVIRAAGPQDTRVEPNTVRESRAMAESSRARLFVVFLDTYHVDVGASHAIRKPLIDALDRLIGADDLVAVMTPEMSARDITFARKTTTIDGFLTKYWHWGERDRTIPPDPEDEAYGMCYPNARAGGKPDCSDQNGIAAATSWILGPSVGQNTLTATASGLAGSPLTFMATGLNTATISVVNNQFQPANNTVGVGTTVRWVWASGAGPHTVTPDVSEPPRAPPSGTASAPFTY